MYPPILKEFLTMGTYKLIASIGFVLAFAYGCKKNKNSQNNISIENLISTARIDEPVILDLKKAISDINTTEENLNFKIPFQLIDSDEDGANDQLMLLMNFEAKEIKNIGLQDILITDSIINFPKRTQAEISYKIDGEWKEREYIGGHFTNTNELIVPPEHKDHSWFIRYEGPGWESDKVGYRFYLDWRNATDIFGKKTNDMVLQNVGQDGFDSYHEPSDWGMDVLKVGKSLGVGSIGMWVNGKAERIAETSSLESKIICNGNIFSKIKTIYHGWRIDDKQIDLTSYLSIVAGSRMTHEEILLSENVENLCTGIVKLPEADFISQSQPRNSGWGYIATYGKQSLNEDNLGLAVLFKNDDLGEMTEDEFSHVIVLKPKFKKLDYYFLGAWELEKEGIKNKQQFIDYLNEMVERLNQPITINELATK